MAFGPLLRGAPTARNLRQLLLGSLVAGVGVTAGCAPPIPSGGFKGPDPASRIYAAADVAARFERTGDRPDRATLEQLVIMLASADPAARFMAGDTLRLVTGMDLGYRASAPLAERTDAARRWRDWVADLPDAGPEERA